MERIDCKGCIWYDQCHKEIRCDLYDGADEEEDNYIWSEMEYNKNRAEKNKGKEKDVYEVGEMESWYLLNNHFQ